MNISKLNITNLNINKEFKAEQKTTAFNGQLKKDCFQRTTNPSFGSSLDGLFDSSFGNFFKTFSSLTGVMKRYNDELRIEALIITFSDKSMKNVFTQLRNRKVEDLLSLVPDVTPILPLFQETGINTLFQLEQFVKNYNKANQSKPVLAGQGIEAVKIHGKLSVKEDLANFGELLLYLYNEEENANNPNFNKLNEYTAFLKQIGIKKFNEFDDKFGHLKAQFNNFENISDKADAIEYLITTYQNKKEFLSEITKENPTLKGKDAEKIYTAIPDIVDYYYAETEGKSLGDLSSIIELALSHGKLKTQALKQLEVSKKELKTPEQKIEFYRFLKDCDVSITDFNAIAGKSFIENPQHDILDQLINKKYLSECIQELKGCKKEDAEEFYRGFTDVINATYDEETGDLENLSTIIDIANKYNIKNSDGILRLYNDATKQNKKSMTTEELCNFIDLFKYSDAKNILEDAKRQKVKAIDLLTAEKQAFEKIKQEIEDYIQNDDSAYFAGESALSIYKKYTKLFKDANDSVFTILEIISGKDTQAAEKQKQKEESINAFSKYFSSKEETLNFINANQIKFETKQREIEYKDNCITILNALLSTQNADEKIEYFTNSGFLTKSKNRLNEFLAKTPQAKTRQEVLSIIAEKKIPSINHLEKFLHDFGTDNNSDIKLLEFLRNLPDNIDFTECLQILNNLQKKLNNLNLPIQITADNINRIDLSEYKSSNKIQSQEIAALLDKMLLPTQGKNFLTALPDSTQKTTNKISAYKIAKELAFNLDNSQESYHNLTRILGLSKSSLNLTADISTYLYIDAILEKLPQEFIDFVNSDDWLKYSDEEGKEIPNVSLHARLRAIDRFALNGIDDINELYSEETKEKLRNLFRSVYTQTPIDIKGTEQTKQIVANHMHNSVVLETVFSPKGKLVTIVQKRK